MEENCCGYCVDGHMHLIKPDYVAVARARSVQFDSSMFYCTIIDERDKTYLRRFFPLEPTNCPHLDSFLEFKHDEIYPPAEEHQPILGSFPPFSMDPNFKYTPIAYILEFERQPERTTETKDIGRNKLYELIKDSIPELNRNVEEISYETLRQTFLRTRWSLNMQEIILTEFLNCEYPMNDQQTPGQFIILWSKRFMNHTGCLSRYIVRQLLRKVPREYEEPLKPHLDGTKWYDLIDDVTSFEQNNSDKLAKYINRSPVQGDPIYNNSNFWIIAVIILVMLVAFYNFFVNEIIKYL